MEIRRSLDYRAIAFFYSNITSTTCKIPLRYHVRSITHDRQSGHGTIKVICLSEISLMPCAYATTG
ncbi:hypothetical protein [Microseira wollei]|uniref:hypothetical protein n=1 Tax=Microseira wollei TaxID=467598 RepID=UPI001CFF4367|nr:hypothetical protein [Microseira wollei]